MRVAILILLLIIQYNCYSCDCNSVVGLKEAKSVFTGEVIAINKIDDSLLYYEITFKITKVIKGEIISQTIIVNAPGCLFDACCGIPFKLNDKYMVYTFLRKPFKHEYVNLCTETKLL